MTINSENLILNKISDDIPVTVQENFSAEIKVIGLSDELLNVETQNIKASVDVSGITKGAGTVEVPITFTVENTTGCWVYGDYTVKITA